MDAYIDVDIRSAGQQLSLLYSYFLSESVTNLLVFWMCSYIIGALVPLFVMFAVKYNRYFKIAYAYVSLMIFYKIAIPITLRV